MRVMDLRRTRNLLGALLSWGASACHGTDGPTAPCEGADCAAPGLIRAFEKGAPSSRVRPRADFGGLKVRRAAGRTFVLETTQDAEGRDTRRLTVSARDGTPLWRFDAVARDHLSDFTVHPSGEVTVGLERTIAPGPTYDLVRLSSEGKVLSWERLPIPRTVPEADLGGTLLPPAFHMKSAYVHALTDGWLRTEARGEDLAVAFLSLVAVPPGEPASWEQASGVMTLQWKDGRYTEQWTRVVDGSHFTQPAAWAYDEFRWREAALRPLLAVDADGRLVVGRTWNSSRCLASSRTFNDFTSVHCRSGDDVTTPSDTERQPFAMTAFTPVGTRIGTHVFVPTRAAEFVVFDMAVRDGEVALAGTVVTEGTDGTIAWYPSAPGVEDRMTPYDGYLGVLSLDSGALRFEHRVDTGRADHFSALRWTDAGLVAVGASGWDRWDGGMSISRGAGPLLALASTDGQTVRTRRPGPEGQGRHFHLLGVDADGDSLVAVGLAEAPLTHSGDNGHLEAMTFGGLTVELR
ncbi:hypothetical protein [Corallococcus exiguus]|uniref:Lipoprotein n=1 Tax=Corallococcus exiguus TaxID=83462 RepID=A0A7X4Y9A7_9BACT|nr:hypothetical protein [Corallococcus exiguus]NBC41166.1 hypothetical protein [Corallococcus exiguus]TNV64537.1 hypothetical protein FH620_12080 [Corallococcus exiguus]